MVLGVAGKGYWKALSPELSSQSSPSLMRFQTRCAPSPCTARRTPAAALTHTMAELLMLTMLRVSFSVEPCAATSTSLRCNGERPHCPALTLKQQSHHPKQGASSHKPNKRPPPQLCLKNGGANILTPLPRLLRIHRRQVRGVRHLRLGGLSGVRRLLTHTGYRQRVIISMLTISAPIPIVIFHMPMPAIG